MKVLIVDDDEITSDLIEIIVSSAGHETRTAIDGREGLELFGRFAPDLVITDIQMPRMNGLELLAAIRQQNADAIVIVATAYGSEEYALDALRRQANNYLKKPVEPKQLLALLRQYAVATEARNKERAVSKFITDSTLTMTFGNQLELVYDIVDYLIGQASRHVANADVSMLRLGLAELITNAIEHGNLGITYDMKTEALNAGDYDKIIERRRADPAYATRNVSVRARIDGRSCEWTIADDGDGFDWASMPAEITPDLLFSSHGRGIILSRLHFDELEYLGRGNKVRVLKRFAG
ncbi:response regulator [bacterium]|nr:response regulator [bacterium]